ncbi:MAG: hypothetical protein JXR84_22950 [Anaerolineae bacterium]|nr:hypothetical protein [Anaerolineae bacterium]
MPEEEKDPSLYAGLPQGLQVFPVKSQPFRFHHVRERLQVMQRPLGWCEAATTKGLQILQDAPINAIWATWGPRAAHHIASQLHAKTGTPWIADYRDITERDFEGKGIDWVRQTWLYDAERKLIASAAYVTTVTPAWVDILRQRLRRDVELLTNAFDPGDFELFAPDESSVDQRDGRFHIVHCGNISTNLYPFLETFLYALKEAITRIGTNEDEITCELIGNDNTIIREIISRTQTQPYVAVRGRVSRREAIQAIRQANALLLFAYPGQGRHTAKLLDYLGAGIPILSFPRDPGGAADVLEETKAGIVINAQEELVNMLSTKLQEWRTGTVPVFSPIKEAVEKYSWRENIRKMVGLLNHLVDGSEDNGR